MSKQLIEDIPVKLGRIAKRAYQQFIVSDRETKQMVFIVGDQRSGTTMLSQCFGRDFRAKVYGERGFAKIRRRLRPFDEIEQIIAAEKAPLIVSKPLVESQNILKLLDYFLGSKAIWMYRHYRDVANSSFNRFGTRATMDNLGPIVNPDINNNHWSAEGVSESTRAIVTKYFSEDMLPYDGKALIWYVRNILFFELDLYKNPNIMLCKYEDVVTNPRKVMRNIYCFLDYKYPGDYIVRHIHSRSVNLGNDIKINKEIEAICANLLQRMDQIYPLYNNGLQQKHVLGEHNERDKELPISRSL